MHFTSNENVKIHFKKVHVSSSHAICISSDFMNVKDFAGSFLSYEKRSLGCFSKLLLLYIVLLFAVSVLLTHTAML